MAQLLNKRLNHIMISTNNKLIVIGGVIHDAESSTWPDVMSGEVYDCEANQWTYLLTLMKPVFNFAFFTMNNCLYIMGENKSSHNCSINPFIQKINLSTYLEINNTSGNTVGNINNDVNKINHNKVNHNNKGDGCQILNYNAERSLIYHVFGTMISSKQFLK
ncbi:hypothetical protein HELRODRAFT_172605 [Helobdella robusta]|uniref:Uncharacterized protein n=1 Tax=Helobdella robusta TaxID=6412 RepID=T1F5L8_HELRO|nr:hypothetical protein HELRODRAFT_172605 [Helobdella robusta]ESO04249.1 hypothetical protein HELRODRAFT_172605 [Helobdella robusta]